MAKLWLRCVAPANLHHKDDGDDINHNELIGERLDLTPFDLRLLDLHHIQRGLLYHNKPPSDSDTNFIQHLQATLSRTLDILYPLAGRLVNTINTDDETTCFSLTVIEPSPFRSRRFDDCHKAEFPTTGRRLNLPLLAVRNGAEVKTGAATLPKGTWERGSWCERRVQSRELLDRGLGWAARLEKRLVLLLIKARKYLEDWIERPTLSM
uniref:Uncharacterized protein n=1 Tax=Cannabis sativa TaxID=3483 RepID=A0A803PSP7_CANSA